MLLSGAGATFAAEPGGVRGARQSDVDAGTVIAAATVARLHGEEASPA